MLLKFLTLLLVVSAYATEETKWFGEKLSDKEPGSLEYNHEAFLGKSGAKEFEGLDPEETERRLGEIFVRIDKNGDQNVSESELKDWIISVQNRYIDENADQQFDMHDLNHDDVIPWDEYLQAYYKYRDIKDQDDVYEDQKIALDMDRVKFLKADLNADDQCSRDEFRAFVHPERYDHMHEFVLKDSLRIMDINEDGYIDRAEYVTTMKKLDKSEKQSDWLSEDQRYFDDSLDKNKDGILDSEELLLLMIPSTIQETEDEAKHLITIADDNEDGMISKHEMLTHRDVFISSASTDYGQVLHDEF